MQCKCHKHHIIKIYIFGQLISQNKRFFVNKLFRYKVNFGIKCINKLIYLIINKFCNLLNLLKMILYLNFKIMRTIKFN